MHVPEFWIVAGPNGAGKTSCVQRKPLTEILPEQVRFLNPDDHTRSLLIQAGYTGFSDAPADVLEKLFKESANSVYEEILHQILVDSSVGVETVLSTDKYLAICDKVLKLDWFVGLVYIALSSPELAVQRVAQRVQKGGHDVPQDKIHERWKKSLDQLAVFASQVDAFWVFDNSTPATNTESVVLLAQGVSGNLTFLHNNCFSELKAVLQRISPSHTRKLP